MPPGLPGAAGRRSTGIGGMVTTPRPITVLGRKVRETLRTSLYRNAAYLVLTSGLNSLSGFVFWAVAARIYPVEGVGLASAAISAMGLLALLSTLGMDYSLIRFLPGSGDRGNDILSSCLTLGGLVSVVLTVVFLAGIHWWSPALLRIQQNPVFFASFTLFALASVLKVFTERTFVAARRAGLALVQGLLFGLLRFVPLLALAPLFDVFGIFASWGIALSLAVAVGIPFLLPRVRPGYCPVPRLHLRAVGSMMRFSFANYAANIMWAIPVLGLPVLVVNRLGAEANAYFYVGWALGYLLVNIPVTVSLSLFAEGSNAGEHLARNIARSLKLLLLLVPVIAIFFLVGDEVLALFGSAYADNATSLLWVLAVSALPVGVNHTFFALRRIQGKMRDVVGLSVFITAGTMVGSYFLLPRLGIVGVGLGWLVPQAIAAAVVMPGLLRYRHGSAAEAVPQTESVYHQEPMAG